MVDPNTGRTIVETIPQYIVRNDGAQPAGCPRATPSGTVGLGGTAPDITINVNLAKLSQMDLASSGSVPSTQETVTNLFLHELGHAFGIVSALSQNTNQETIFDSYLTTTTKGTFFKVPNSSLQPIQVDLNNRATGGTHLMTGLLDILNAGAGPFYGANTQTLTPNDRTILRLIDPPTYGEIDIPGGTTFDLSEQAFAGQDIGFLTMPGSRRRSIWTFRSRRFRVRSTVSRRAM